MLHHLPDTIAESVYGVLVAQRALAYLQVDGDLKLVRAGGHLAEYGLANLRIGDAANEQVLFLEGFLPLVESPFIVRAMEMAEGRAADVQFYEDGDTVWILLVDVTAERDATRRVQQKAYEMTLLQEKEALLNRRLEAANAALRAAHSEIERSKAALVEAYAQLEVELAEAAAYVRSILPAPMATPFVAEWRFVPSARLGGDCFGYHWIDDDHFALYLLDVCGHGVGPSLLSAGALNTIRSGSLPGADLRDPGQSLAVLNDLFQMDRHNDLFFSLWYGVYSPSTRRLAYASAGHPPAILVPPHAAGAGDVVLLKGKGPLIGIVPEAAWSVATIEVTAGSRLYVVSDGTFEVSRPDGTMMDMADLVSFLAAQAPGSDSDLDDLLAHLRREHGNDGLEDDFSIVRLGL